MNAMICIIILIFIVGNLTQKITNNPSPNNTKYETKNPTRGPTQNTTIPTLIPTQNPTQKTNNHSPNNTKYSTKNLCQNSPNNTKYSTESHCSPQDIGFINTSYTISLGHQSCINGILDFISEFIEIIDVVYSQNCLLVSSNITTAELMKFSHCQDQQVREQVCGNITLHTIICFKDETVYRLLNVTKSNDFLVGINDEIDNKYNDTIVYKINTTIIIIETNVKNPINLLLLIAVFATAICSCIIIFLMKRKHKLSKIAKQMIIKNAMVICLGIGHYEQEPNEPDSELQNSFLADLAIDRDIDNLHGLFGSDYLNYDIYPKMKQLRWTQKQMIDLLSEKAQALHDNLTDDTMDKKQKFDGLFVAVSSHGFHNAIATSDYKLIDKDAIHRIFSAKFPISRTIPRIFLFDCCDGSQEYGVRQTKEEMVKNATKKVGGIELQSAHTSTRFKIDDINESAYGSWQKGEKNPDHLLVEIHAANKDFQSKLHSSVFGSYMIYEFVKSQLDELNALRKGKHGLKFIHEHFDEIERYLEDKGKQKITKKFGDLTRYIVFEKNKNGISEDIEMEMKTN
eukprot:268853_1